MEPEILLPLSLAGVIDDGGASDGGPLATPLKRAEATCGRCTSVVLCGDHMQLGPMVRSPFCRSHGLGASLLERLMALPLYSQASSRVCYPPRPQLPIARVPVGAPPKLYYDESLKAHADAKRAKALEQWEELPTKGCPLLFFGVVGQLSFEAGSTSYWNDVEASKVASLIQQLVRVDEHGRPIGGGERTSGEGGDGAAAARARATAAAAAAATATGRRRRLKTSDVAVVTLFRKQVLKIRQLLRKIGLGAVRVGTVDDYQGQEEKVVIISTVLSHSHPHAPALFSSSAKRFNVAITRAMALLIVVANPLALYDDKTWRPLLKYATDKGAYRGCAHPLCMEGAEGTAADEMALLKALRGELGSADSKRTSHVRHASSLFPARCSWTTTICASARLMLEAVAAESGSGQPRNFPIRSRS